MQKGCLNYYCCAVRHNTSEDRLHKWQLLSKLHLLLVGYGIRAYNRCDLILPLRQPLILQFTCGGWSDVGRESIHASTRHDKTHRES